MLKIGQAEFDQDVLAFHEWRSESKRNA
jgi:hypothetical protein